MKAILAPLKLIGQVDAATWFCADLFALNVILRMMRDGRWGNTQELNFHRLRCTRKAQSVRYCFMKSKFKVS